VTAAKRHYVSDVHVIWAYEHHVVDLYKDGKTVAEIRAWLLSEYSLSVGENAIRAVLQSRGLAR
jgi:hypothetical protein